MSSLTAILNSAVSSMQAAQLGLSVASNNISNAHSPEYTRQRLVTVPGAAYGTFPSVGSGVDVVGIEALRDSLIESRRLQVNSDRASDDLLNKTLSDIEVNFDDSNNS